jgi:hypothetical protein
MFCPFPQACAAVAAAAAARYLHWVSCPNELPPTLSAYKTQQYRWNSGPMVVIKGLLGRIWSTDRVGLLDRLSCTYFFFRCVKETVVVHRRYLEYIGNIQAMGRGHVSSLLEHSKGCVLL